ncbi:hypothetical protein KKD62_02630, partial [Patescibacteria group bacterium]|nr:hypothetical protein [Patescibacteria group bacterium]MBU1931837.1 hypothetical protein [Patescibacteria group bacterium]
PSAALDIVGDLEVNGYATVSSSLALGSSSAAAGPGHLTMSGNLIANGSWTADGVTIVNDGGTIEADSLTQNDVDETELASTTVGAGSYGSATQVGTFTVDADGRLTAAGNTTITGVSPVGSALTSAYIWVGNVSNLAAAVNPGGDVEISNTGVTTIQADAVTLGTDTIGNYVASITGGSGISSTGATSGENIAHTLSLGALTADWDAGGYEIRSSTFESDVVTGTAPLTVASTTLVTNLNADLLDGYSYNNLPYDNYGDWDLFTDGVEQDSITTGEDVGFDSGTGINVSWDASRDVGFSFDCSDVDGSGISCSGETLQLGALTADWDAGGYEIRSSTFESDVVTGTAPLTVASTTLVTNLNADLLDGQTGSYYLDDTNYGSWTLAGSGGTPQTISSGNTATFAGGTGITTSAAATDILNLSFDSTEIGTTTWYNGTAATDIIWTFDGETNDGTFGFYEDEDAFAFTNASVGIGTTSPGAKLDVVGGHIRIDDGNAIYFGSVNNNYPHIVGSNTTDQLIIGEADYATDGLIIYMQGYVNFQDGHNDFAEYFISDDTNTDKGNIVASSPTNREHIINSLGTKESIIGIISTNPSLAIRTTEDPNAVPVALVGRVPVKIWSSDGAITNGNSVTSSSIPGIGMKSTKSGPIVGKALESIEHWNQQNCPLVSSLDSISWPEDDGSNPAKPCFRLPNGTYVGKIMVFVNVSWYDPDVFLTDTGDVRIIAETYDGDLGNLTADGLRNLDYWTEKTGEAVKRIGVFAELAVGKIRAGLVDTTNLIAENLVAGKAVFQSITTNNAHINELIATNIQSNKLLSPLVETDNLIARTVETEMIKPIADKDLILQIRNSKFEIQNEKQEELFALDPTGNATFSGEITADSGRFRKLYADEIEGLEAKVGTLAAQTIVNQYYYEDSTEEKSLEPPEAPEIDLGTWEASGSGSYLDIAGIDAETGLFSEFLAVLGQASIVNLEVTNNLVVMGIVDIMAGKVTINDAGNVYIEGDLTVNGRLAANNLETREATVSASLFANLLKPINGNLAVQLDEIQNSKFEIRNSLGNEVASVNASGSANFKQLKIATAESIQSGNLLQPEITTNATTGQAVLPALETTITIKSPFITNESLVYITPESDTQNQVLYVTAKAMGEFKVAINQAINQDVKFNWWVIN